MALLGACLCACSGAPLAGGTRAAAQGLEGDPDRYIVAGVDNEAGAPLGRAGSTPRGYDTLTVYGPSSRAARQLKNVERDYDLHEVSAWPIAPLHMHCAVLKVSATADRAAVIAQLSHDPRVRIAQPLQSFSTQSAVYNDPYVELQRGFQQMDVPDAHLQSRGEGVRVALIDTGVDTRHPDLRGVVVQSRNFVDADADQFLRDRHGTELAGVIGAVANNHEGIVGVAPGARLFAFKACWQLRPDVDEARCNTFTLAQALTAALDSHVQVVNLSLSGPADPLLRALIGEGQHRGILFVGAAPAGSSGEGDGLLSLEGVIQVVSGGLRDDQRPALHAPGREILTLLPGGHYDFASGTSLATAHVTGAVALLLAKDPRLTADAAYALLRDTSARLSAADDSVDACAAVAGITGVGSCRAGVVGEKRVAMH